MPKATWNGKVIAEAKSEETEKVEGNVYFPLSALKKEFFKEAKNTTVCSWKGTANYFDIEVGGKTNTGAAWTYKEPKPAAAKIKNFVAFWKGVKVES
eukprot:CAMPEP_0170198744 /NCGR_PEP_ID=MMETSP0040_2-20121228/68955_1 /TAXON_ID=641309 /ORGANISM="Lotharella oceanica, Strain CCMP622" /LENGTH=96 /DNA_ID=CAMNT_0010448791 /DNA_START=531 /DNA_END=821 /DNA_ORIENTATION=+